MYGVSGLIQARREGKITTTVTVVNCILHFLFCMDVISAIVMFCVVKSNVVTTPKNYYWYMDKEGLDYIPASPPDIIVRSLTEENIRKAIESYLDDDGYWLKLYFLAGKREGTFAVKAMDKMIEEIKETNKKVFGGKSKLLALMEQILSRLFLCHLSGDSLFIHHIPEEGSSAIMECLDFPIFIRHITINIDISVYKAYNIIK